MKKGERSGQYRKCEQCEAMIYVYPSQIRRGRRYCSAACYSKGRAGTGNPNWQGGRCRTASGYIYVHRPDHPNCTKDGYVMEHRLVMEEKIGRLLDPKEEVHHLNHVKDDNRPENLELMSDAAAHRIRHAYYRPTECAECGRRVERSMAHRRRFDRAFCTRRCGAKWASRLGGRARADQARRSRAGS